MTMERQTSEAVRVFDVLIDTMEELDDAGHSNEGRHEWIASLYEALKQKRDAAAAPDAPGRPLVGLGNPELSILAMAGGHMRAAKERTT